MTDDRQQTLTRCQKTGKGCIGPQSLYGIQSLRFRLPDPNRNAFSFPAALFQIKDSSTVRSLCIQTKGFMDQFCKTINDGIVSVDYKYFFRLLFKSPQPFQQALPVCMAADAVQFTDLRSHFNLFTKEFYFICPFNDRSSQCSDCLISDKKGPCFPVSRGYASDDA